MLHVPSQSLMTSPKLHVLLFVIKQIPTVRDMARRKCWFSLKDHVFK